MHARLTNEKLRILGKLWYINGNKIYLFVKFEKARCKREILWLIRVNLLN